MIIISYLLLKKAPGWGGAWEYYMLPDEYLSRIPFQEDRSLNQNTYSLNPPSPPPLSPKGREGLAPPPHLQGEEEGSGRERGKRQIEKTKGVQTSLIITPWSD